MKYGSYYQVGDGAIINLASLTPYYTLSMDELLTETLRRLHQKHTPLLSLGHTSHHYSHSSLIAKAKPTLQPTYRYLATLPL